MSLSEATANLSHLFFTYLHLTSRNDGFPDRLLLSTPPSVALHEEEIDEWNEVLLDSYENVKLSRVYSFVAEFNEAAARGYSMSEDGKVVFRRYANEIADKLNEQWRERNTPRCDPKSVETIHRNGWHDASNPQEEKRKKNGVKK